MLNVVRDFRVLSVLKKGSVFVIDELGNSLHPYLFAEIVRMFKDSKGEMPIEIDYSSLGNHRKHQKDTSIPFKCDFAAVLFQLIEEDSPSDFVGNGTITLNNVFLEYFKAGTEAGYNERAVSLLARYI